MASPSYPSSPGESTNLAPVSASDDLAIPTGLSDPEAIQRTHLREEAYAKTVGKVNYLYALLFGASGAYLIHLAFLHVSGEISAAWVVRPGWIAVQAVACMIAALALAAGHGFGRLEPWALRVEACFVLCYLIHLPLYIFASSRPMSLGELASGVVACTALLVPLIDLFDLRKSEVFTPEYRSIVAATPGVHIKAKLSWQLKLLMLALLVIAVIIYAFTAAP